jgi:hypothetical protein
MSYRVLETETGYAIMEKESDVRIELNKSEKEIRDLCRKLNLGSGFNGWTPPFFASSSDGL